MDTAMATATDGATVTAATVTAATEKATDTDTEATESTVSIAQRDFVLNFKYPIDAAHCQNSVAIMHSITRPVLGQRVHPRFISTLIRHTFLFSFHADDEDASGE